VPEIEWTRRAVLDHILPSIPDPKVEGERAQKEAWETLISRPSDGSDDPGTFAEWAQEQAIQVYERLSNMRQTVANMAAVMLWQLMEQQMLMYHMHQVLNIHEEQEVRGNKKHRDKMYRLGEFHSRLEIDGYSMKSLPSWSKIDELRLIANVVKHGSGPSLDDLSKLRPDLLEPPGIKDISLLVKHQPSWVERPAGGEDLFVRDADLVVFFDAAARLWQEFSIQIEEHSARR
jgi:hypothetical protein